MVSGTGFVLSVILDKFAGGLVWYMWKSLSLI